MLYYTVLYPTILYGTPLHCIILYFTILYCIVLYSIMLFHTKSHYIIRNIILYYTQVGPGDRPASPGGRPAPKCRGVWGAATTPSGESGGSAPRAASWFRMLPAYFRM